MRPKLGSAALALVALTKSIGTTTVGARADTIPTVHFRELASGPTALH
jgi:hypothetical protein